MVLFPVALGVLALVALVAGGLGLGLAKTFTKHSYRLRDGRVVSVWRRHRPATP
ncbi:MAG: hypothetical protein ACRDPJ_17960 [Nocardioidaceae bacterium]